MNIKLIAIVFGIITLGLVVFNLNLGRKTTESSQNTVATNSSVTSKKPDTALTILDKLKKKTPYTLANGEMTVDNAFIGLGKEIRIEATLLKYNLSSFSTEAKQKMMTNLKSQFIQTSNVCANTEEHQAMEEGYKVSYVLYDKNKNYIGEVNIVKEDCAKR